jgi:hypothetical protein
VKLLEQMAKRSDPKQVYIEQPGFSLRMAKRSGTETSE